MDRSVYILLFTLLLSSPVLSQEVYVTPADPDADTTEITSMIPENAPRLAFLYSALLPGLGQAYNQQYWKMPIVYGGFVGFGYMIGFYNGRYRLYKDELFNLLEDPSYVPPSGATEEQLRTVIDRARRERDYMIVLTTVFYILQIVDAHVDAHLRDFELNPDLQLSLKPSAEPVMTSAAVGIGVSIRFQP